jgi:teichuronic acid biosynthesis glycosyltransferase TuaC
MLTSVWPTAQNPFAGPFIRNQVAFLQRAGVQLHVFHVNGRKNPLNYVRAQRRVRDLISRNKFDLIHAQWGQSALPALPKQLPLVVTFRGSDVEGYVAANGSYTLAGRVLTCISRSVARIADEAIIVSSHLAARLPKREYHVIPSGLDLDMFRAIPQDQARQQLGLRPDRRYALFAASPSNPIKRYQLAQAAVHIARAKHDLELLIADRCAQQLIPVYMSACDALLLTSVHEGSPNVIKEALACDLPIVALDVGDVRERIGSLEGCALCHSDDPHTIAEGLTHVLNRGRPFNGRESVRHLNEACLTQRIISVYRKALT